MECSGRHISWLLVNGMTVPSAQCVKTDCRHILPLLLYFNGLHQLSQIILDILLFYDITYSVLLTATYFIFYHLSESTTLYGVAKVFALEVMSLWQEVLQISQNFFKGFGEKGTHLHYLLNCVGVAMPYWSDANNCCVCCLCSIQKI